MYTTKAKVQNLSIGNVVYLNEEWTMIIKRDILETCPEQYRFNGINVGFEDDTIEAMIFPINPDLLIKVGEYTVPYRKVWIDEEFNVISVRVN